MGYKHDPNKWSPEYTFEYKSHRIAQRLRDINGDSTTIRIKGRVVRVWSVPAFDNADVDITLKDFDTTEVPF